MKKQSKYKHFHAGVSFPRTHLGYFKFCYETEKLDIILKSEYKHISNISDTSKTFIYLAKMYIYTAVNVFCFHCDAS